MKKQSSEGAAGKAIVVVPNSVDVKAHPDVLLFFHGMGNLGYRERLTDDKSRGPAGSVHDVEADRMEQQLAHSGRNIVAVLPQGTNAATFGIADPQAYVTEVARARPRPSSTCRRSPPAGSSFGPQRRRTAGRRRGHEADRPRRPRPTTNGSTNRRCSSSTASTGRTSATRSAT